MKVKCRGFEGNLISINPTTEIKGLNMHYQTYLYAIRISVNIGQEVIISGVSDDDIEFIGGKINDLDFNSSLDTNLV